MSDALADLTAQGVSIWLDDISRERLVTGNLQVCRRQARCRCDEQPDDLPESVWKKATYTTIKSVTSRSAEFRWKKLFGC